MKIMKKNKLFLSILFIFILAVSCFANDQQNLGRIDYLLLLRTSFVMMGLLALSVVTLAFAVERFLYFRSIKFNSESLMKEVGKFAADKKFDEIISLCNKNSNPLTNVIKTIIENRDKSIQDMEELYEIVRTKEKENMEKFMVILGSSAAVGPLFGLLGTVVGIIKAFADLAVAGSGGPSVIAAGVSEALVATAFGLIIAIPALLLYNFFNNKIKVVLAELDINIRLLFFVLEKK